MKHEKENLWVKQYLHQIYDKIGDIDLEVLELFDQMILTQIQSDLKRHEYEKAILKAKNN